MFIFMGLIMWFWIAIMCFGDIFRRGDMGGFMKTVWILLIIFMPLLGTLLYLIFNNNGIAERNAKSVEAARASFDQQIRTAAGTGGPAGEIDTARKLLDAGTITQAEFDVVKAKALAG